MPVGLQVNILVDAGSNPARPTSFTLGAVAQW